MVLLKSNMKIISNEFMGQVEDELQNLISK